MVLKWIEKPCEKPSTFPLVRLGRMNSSYSSLWVSSGVRIWR